MLWEEQTVLWLKVLWWKDVGVSSQQWQRLLGGSKRPSV